MKTNRELHDALAALIASWNTPEEIARRNAEFEAQETAQKPAPKPRTRKPKQVALFDHTAVDDWGDTRDTRTTMKRLL